MTIKNQKVSLITPIYNVGLHLERCLESLVNQTYTNIELLLVLDKTSDEQSTEIAIKYSDIDTRIKLIYRDHRGPADARNAGLFTATGEYIMFVDADDYVEANYVELLLKAISTHTVDMAICGCRFEPLEENQPFEEYSSSGVMYQRDYIKFMLTDKQRFLSGVIWNKIYKKELLEGIQFRNGKLSEDLFFSQDIAFSIDKVVFIPNILYHYVQREGSTSRDLDYLHPVKSEVYYEIVSHTSIIKDWELYNLAWDGMIYQMSRNYVDFKKANMLQDDAVKKEYEIICEQAFANYKENKKYIHGVKRKIKIALFRINRDLNPITLVELRDNIWGSIKRK